jgi:hypothetical protein
LSAYEDDDLMDMDGHQESIINRISSSPLSSVPATPELPPFPDLHRRIKGEPPTPTPLAPRRIQIIDLTKSSDSSDAEQDKAAAQVDSEVNDPFLDPSKPKAQTSNGKGEMRVNPWVKGIVGTEASSKSLPPYDDPTAIAEKGNDFYIRLEEKRRLLITVLHKLDLKVINAIISLVKSMSKYRLWGELVKVLKTNKEKRSRIAGMLVQDYDHHKTLGWMFACWVQVRILRESEDIPRHTIESLLEDDERFFRFHGHLENALDCYREDDDDEDPRPAIRNRVSKGHVFIIAFPIR